MTVAMESCLRQERFRCRHFHCRTEQGRGRDEGGWFLFRGTIDRSAIGSTRWGMCIVSINQAQYLSTSTKRIDAFNLRLQNQFWAL